MTDPIADMLIRIKNASAVRHETVLVPHSKLKVQLADILVHEGFLKEAIEKKKGVRKYIQLTLGYDENSLPFVQDMKRMSKPGRRLYLKANMIRPVKHGYGRAIISTPKGLMTDKQARKQHLGGEFICTVW